MRHRKAFNHLGRQRGHRKAMLANMANSLILNKRITTTEAKAKALRTFLEPLITKSKEDTTHSRRIVFRYLRSKEAVTELFREISPKVMTRQGGYTRILKLGNRLGDNAEMCMIELVDYNENMLASKETKKSRSRRRRGSGKKKGPQAAETADTAAAEAPDENPESGMSENQEVQEETADVETQTPEENQQTEEKPAEKPKETKEEKPQPEARAEDEKEEKTEEKEAGNDPKNDKE